MKCTAPIWLAGQQVPCGRCLACKKARSGEWTVRLTHELEYHEKAAFVTLTYDDDHMPESGSLQKEDYVNWMKRIRKQTQRKYAYYMCGEYGTQTDRPHYHAIIFGLAPCGSCQQCSKDNNVRWLPPLENTDCDIVAKTWGMGNVQLGTVTSASIRYVTGYIDKAHGEKNLGGRELPFSLMSKGLGLKWMEDHKEQLEKDHGIRVGTKIYNMPRYYQRKLSNGGTLHSIISGWLLQLDRIRNARSSRQEWIDQLKPKAKPGTIRTVPHMMGQHNRQTNRNLNAKANLQERDT